MLVFFFSARKRLACECAVKMSVMFCGMCDGDGCHIVVQKHCVGCVIKTGRLLAHLVHPRLFLSSVTAASSPKLYAFALYCFENVANMRHCLITVSRPFFVSSSGWQHGRVLDSRHGLALRSGARENAVGNTRLPHSLCRWRPASSARQGT